MAGNNSPTSLAALQRSEHKWDGSITDLGDVSASNLILDLSRRLTDGAMGSGISNRSTFVNKACNIPIYEESQPISRFMLLVAQHNSIPDSENLGHVLKGAQGVFNGFTLKHWIEEKSNSVEHIAPQTRPNPEIDDWDDSVFDHPNTVHTIGNLALCPKPVNSAAGNRPWAQKRVIYKAAASTTTAQARQILDQGTIAVSDDFYAVVEYIPYLSAIGEMEDGIWDEAFISARSENLLGLVWDRLAPWLGISV
jgi:hypothetical protein